MRKAGFTLIEMLVVLAIMLVLAAIAVPAFASVRERGMTTRCAANLRNVGTAINLFAADNNELITPLYADSRFWPAALTPYISTGSGQNSEIEKQKVLRCPSFNYKPADFYRTGYGLSRNILRPQYDDTWNQGQQDRVRQILVSRPSRVILAGDSDEWFLYKENGTAGVVNYGAPRRHQGRANYLLMDGSVVLLEEKEAADRLWNP